MCKRGSAEWRRGLKLQCEEVVEVVELVIIVVNDRVEGSKIDAAEVSFMEELDPGFGDRRTGRTPENHAASFVDFVRSVDRGGGQQRWTVFAHHIDVPPLAGLDGSVRPVVVVLGGVEDQFSARSNVKP